MSEGFALKASLTPMACNSNASEGGVEDLTTAADASPANLTTVADASPDVGTARGGGLAEGRHGQTAES
jgi:hypothetical protein